MPATCAGTGIWGSMGRGSPWSGRKRSFRPGCTADGGRRKTAPKPQADLVRAAAAGVRGGVAQAAGGHAEARIGIRRFAREAAAGIQVLLARAGRLLSGVGGGGITLSGLGLIGLNRGGGSLGSGGAGGQAGQGQGGDEKRQAHRDFLWLNLIHYSREIRCDAKK